MTLALDVNPLAYASNDASPFHSRARAAIDQLVRADEPVYLFWPVVMGYLRVATNRKAFRAPLSFEDAIANMEDLLRLPHFRSGSERFEFMRVLRDIGTALPLQGDLISDAHIVALMRQHDVSTVWTHDRDFRKFDGIRVVDPFA